MGVTIQFESHRVELAFVREMEHDPEVLEYYDQPPSFPLDYKSAKGRHLRVVHTPDFFVLRAASAGWEECKTEEELHRLSGSSPNRYCWDQGSWHCSPGERYARQFGFCYRLRSSAEINWVMQRNLQFLEDYVGTASPRPSQRTKERALTLVSAKPGIALSELLHGAEEGMSRDDINALIAARELYVNLRNAPLAEPTEVRVFANREGAEAWGRVLPNVQPNHDNGCRRLVVGAGHTITWDGRMWRVLNLGDKTMSLLGEDEALTELPVAIFEQLNKGDISEARLQNRASNAGRRSLRWRQRRRGISVSPTGASTPYSTTFVVNRRPTGKSPRGRCVLGCHATERRRLVSEAAIWTFATES